MIMSASRDQHALIASTSRLFTNYRHTSNALLVYDAVRRFGIPDDRIVLMLAGDVPCDPRNEVRPSMYASTARDVDLFPRDVEVDWRKEEVTVENFLGVITDRFPERRVASPRKRLRSNARSRLLLYLTGHGGDGFLKFNDAFELGATEFAAAIRDAFHLHRFSELLVLLDTCQASSMTALLHDANLMATAAGTQAFESGDDDARAPPRIATFASSAVGQNSFSHEVDARLGVAVSDRFTYQIHSFLRQGMSTPTPRTQSSPGTRAAHAPRYTSGRLSDLEAFLTRYGGLRSAIVTQTSGPVEEAADEAAQGVARSAIRSATLGDFRLDDFFGAPSPPLIVVGSQPPPAATAPPRRLKPSYAHWAEVEYHALWGGLPPADIIKAPPQLDDQSSEYTYLAVAWCFFAVVLALSDLRLRRLYARAGVPYT